ncbi:hypothetical protein [Rhodococcus qingshengii]|uniref:hypothetical protein n=1 Tax=Rhodococcus qingshengii TaxID=334542 RepID=UPI001C8B63C5|nr:hypothetical protein [Rhodococcus qingshengii]MBX9150046.1 hypothetical protein [Rhodococcus qingshengii]
MTNVTADECRTAARLLISDDFAKFGGNYVAESNWFTAKADKLDANQTQGAMVEQLAKAMYSANAREGDVVWDDFYYDQPRGAWRDAAGAAIAHLTATGRLLADDETRFTAEQVEDVRLLAASVVKTNRGAAFEARDRLRALFPATEPAEDVKPIGWYRAMTRKFATEHFGFPEVTGLLERTHTASDGGVWGYCGGEWELREYPPAPAEPAEEETKAEEFCCHPDCRNTNWGGRNRKHYRDSDCPPSKEVRLQNALELGRRISEAHKAASSPVVPALTETEWESCGHVPIGIVFRSKDRHPAFTWVNEGGSLLSVRNECEDGHFSDGEHCLPSMVDENFAPFVAAKEG